MNNLSVTYLGQQIGYPDWSFSWSLHYKSVINMGGKCKVCTNSASEYELAKGHDINSTLLPEIIDVTLHTNVINYKT
jgi:hypothetical protein